jgi:hypothetical protein
MNRFTAVSPLISLGQELNRFRCCWAILCPSDFRQAYLGVQILRHVLIHDAALTTLRGRHRIALDIIQA